MVCKDSLLPMKFIQPDGAILIQAIDEVTGRADLSELNLNFHASVLYMGVRILSPSEDVSEELDPDIEERLSFDASRLF